MNATKSQEMGAVILRRGETEGDGLKPGLQAGSGNVSTAIAAEGGSKSKEQEQKARGKEAPTVLLRVAVGKVGPSVACPNPRRSFNPQAMEELVASVKAVGILQPPLVRKLTGKSRIKSNEQEQEFELVAGERRWRAAKAAGLTEMAVLVAELTDSEVVEMQHIENLQREGLTPLEEAESFAKLIGSGKYTAETLAQKLGKDRTTIFNRLRLLKMKKAVRAALEKGEIDTTMAGLIAKVPTEEGQTEALEIITGDRMSFREAKEYIEEEFYKNLSGAPWKWEDAELVKKAGACKDCPKLSGNIPGNDGVKNLCTDLKCYEEKRQAFDEKRLKEARATGVKVIETGAWKRVRYSDKYQKLADKEFVDGKHQPVIDALRKHKSSIRPELAIEENGEVIEVLPMDQLKTELKRLKIKDEIYVDRGSGSSSGNGDARYRKEASAKKVKRQLMQGVRATVIPEIGKAAAKEPKLAFWRCLAMVAANKLSYDELGTACELFDLPSKNPSEKTIPNYVAKLKTEEELRSTAMELFALDGWLEHWTPCFGENFETVAQWAGSEPEKLLKAALAAAKELEESKSKSRIKSKKGK